jgi:hypothetical protein
VEGQVVRLELDVQERDRYGRLLAYVYVGDTMVNAELVARGYAQVMTIPPNVKHQEEFLKLQRKARALQLGLWKDAEPAPSRSAPSLVRPRTTQRDSPKQEAQTAHQGRPGVPPQDARTCRPRIRSRATSPRILASGASTTSRAPHSTARPTPNGATQPMERRDKTVPGVIPSSHRVTEPVARGLLHGRCARRFAAEQ